MPRRTLEQRKLTILARLFPLFERLGFHVTLNHFYEPVPDLRSMPEEIFRREFEMPGVEMNDVQQLALLERFLTLRGEYSSFPVDADPTNEHCYFQRNGQFERVDMEVLYSMVRLHRPRRLIEIGSGYSTLAAAAAIRRNRADDRNYTCDLTCIEPFPRPFLRSLPELTTLIERPVQQVPQDVFSSLASSDILFVDSSHVVKIGSDAQYEFLEIVPRVASGVLIQIHDIFFPMDYPRVFVMDWHRFWNEQYVLQAFLAFNGQFSVRWSSSWMVHRHEATIGAAFPSFARGGLSPSSIWIERA